MIDAIEIQLKTLLENGISLEDACESLDIDVDGARAFLASETQKDLTVDDILKQYKPQCLRALIDIGLDSTLENTSARVTALKTVVEGRGQLPELPLEKYAEAFKKMKEVTSKYKTSATVTTPSPATTQVDIKLDKKELLKK